MFHTLCPYCSQEYTLDDSLLGKTASCKKCRRVFTLKDDTDTSVRIDGDSTTAAEDDSGFELKPPSSKIAMEPQREQIPEPRMEKRFSPESGMWNVGDVVLGIYEVKQLAPNVPFAEGGVGVVHRVYHREWDMDLAVKSPKPHVFHTESGKQSYEKEAQTWIELGLHPNIVTCYLVRRITNIPRLFAEFVADGSLRDWIHDGRLYHGGSEAALLRILNIATQFVWGLEHAHSQKLLHLDVKPANVMMSGQSAKVTDFGLAQGVSELPPPLPTGKSDGQIAAVAAGGMTPGYCSPEQYLAFMYAQRGEYARIPKITLKSDIWSWAVSVLAMFHGRAPCKKGGQTARKVFELFLKADPSEGRPRMPDPLVDLMFRCFEEDAEKRPGSMGEIAEEMVKIYQDASGMPFPRSRPVSATWTPESINNRAASMLDLGKPEEAKKLLDQAAQLQPWHPEVTYNQTLLAWRSARMTDLEVLEKLETLVKTRSQSPASIYALGLAQRERGNFQSALDSFEDAIRMEKREDFRRAYLATEKIAARSARCLERFPVARGVEDGILVDQRGEFILVPTNRETFEMRETSTGRIRSTFLPPKEEQQKKSPSRFGLSEDLLWELIREPNTPHFLLKRVGATSANTRFQPIGWKRFFGKKDEDVAPEGKAKDLYTLPRISWIGEVKESFVNIYDKETKKKIGDLFGHEDTITALAFSEDGRFALTGSTDRSMRLWELPSGRCLRTFPSLGGAVDAVHFGKGGLYALSLIAGGSLRIWDVSMLCNKTPFRAPLLLSHVASAEEVGRQQSEMNQYCENIRQAIKNSDYPAALKNVAKASELSGWEAARKSLDAEGLLDALSRRTVKTSLADALCTSTFVGHHDTVSAIALSLDGNLVVSAGRDQSIRIWNVPEQKCVGVLEGHYDWVRSVEMTMDAKFVVSGSWDMSVRVWNIHSGQCVRKFDEKIKSLTKIAINPQGRTVAVGNGQGAVILWDVLTDDIVGRFLAHSGSVNTIRFSRNGRYLVTGGDDNRVFVWKPGKEDPIRTVKAHHAPVTQAILTPDLNRILSADREGRIVVWNLAEDKMEFDLQGHFGDVTGLEILADDRFFLSCAKDMKVRLSMLDGMGTQRLIEGHPSPILGMALDVTGRRFATGCEDAVVRVWDLYWNYEFPGWSEMSPKAEAILKTLLSVYSPDDAGMETPKVDATILKRIMLEMEYRGFGFILPENIRQAITRQLENWTAPQLDDAGK